MSKDSVYVDNETLKYIAENTKDANLFKYNGHIRSIETTDVVYKLVAGFQTRKDTLKQAIDRANTAKKIWQSKDYSGSPSSPASFFRKKMGKASRIKVSYNNVLRDYLHGGWIEAFKIGTTVGRFFHYDINNAYYWSIFEGLPLRLKPWQKGDTHFLCVFKPDKKTRNRCDLPNYFEKKMYLVTNEDIELYGLKGKLIKGIAWRETDFNIKQRIDDLQYLPSDIWKSITQSYWGGFMAQEGVQVEQKKNGSIKKTWELRNMNTNLVWANIILHKIMRRVWQVAKVESLLVCVDSVLTERQIKTGTLPGRWKLENKFEQGVYIKNAMQWTELFGRSKAPSDWHKYSGVAK